MNEAIRDAMRCYTGSPFHVRLSLDRLVHKYGVGDEVSITTCCDQRNPRADYEWTRDEFTCIACIAWEASL